MAKPRPHINKYSLEAVWQANVHRPFLVRLILAVYAGLRL